MTAALTDRAFRRLHTLSSTTMIGLEPRISALLQAGCELLTLPYGVLCGPDGSVRQEWHGWTGSARPDLTAIRSVQQALCREVLTGGAPRRLGGSGTESPLAAFLGTAVVADGQTLGVLGFGDVAPRAHDLGDEDRDVLGLLAGWLGGLLARESARSSERTHAERVYEDQRLEALARLANAVAHDFRNLLAGLIGCIDLARASLPAEHPALAPLDRARTASDGGVERVGRLLSFARQAPVEPVALDLNQQLTQLAGPIARGLGEQTSIVVDPCPGRAFIVADPGLIQHLLFNLAANAGAAMPRGGTLTIRTVLRTRGGANCVGLIVTDTGIGMPPEVARRAFEPFFTTHDYDEAQGLGLAIVHSIVASLGGEVSVRSAPGQGATFEVWLPHRPPTDPLAADEPRAPSNGRHTALVVDPDELGRTAAAWYLSELGYDVIEASDPREALTACEHTDSSIDVLLADIVLPEMSGPVLAQRVRQTHPEVQAVCMSAYPTRLLVRDGRLLPGQRSLRKPFSKADLIEALSSASL